MARRSRPLAPPPAPPSPRICSRARRRRSSPSSAPVSRLAPGSHVNSVGYNTAGREIDGATIRDALLVVESRAGTLAPPPTGSNDIALAIAEGLVTATHVHAELGELVSGTRPGRTDAAQ